MTIERDAVAQTIASFVTAQIAYWIATRPGRDRSEQSFAALNEKRDDIYVYRFADGDVELLPKAGMTAGEDEDGKTLQQVRALRYLALFRQVLATGGHSFDGQLAMSAHDLVGDSPDIPIFCFQKPAGSKLIQLPDIDAVSLDFYADRFTDNVAYADKSDSGIFIGATTGMHHTEASVAALSSQRLRSGVFFRDAPEVDFRLPTICQCLTPGADRAIRDLGFGVRPGDWTEQFNSKFLLSMDGNGATCSRVAIALKSNSVLVKYASRHTLYYFDALIPYVHYIPVFADSDVIAVVRAERNSPGLFRGVADAGAAFYRDFLAPAPALEYTAKLLRAYFEMLAERSQPILIYDAVEGDRLDVSAVAHVAGRGDIHCSGRGWIGEPGSGQAIEGFAILPTPDEADIALSYQVIDETGAAGDWTEAGSFAGERGVSRRLLGFAIKGAGVRCAYHGRFLDGQETGPVMDGAVCTSPSGAPLEALRVKVTR